MYTDRRSFWLYLLIAALPFFLFMSFRYAFDAQNQQRALERQAFTDAQLIIARSDGIVREALAVARAFAADQAVRTGDDRVTIGRIRDLLAANMQFADATLDDDQGQQVLFSASGTDRPVGPWLAPGQNRVSLAKSAACNCVVISRGFANRSGAARTLHLFLPNRVFLRLLPVGQDQYEVSALADRDGRFIARSLKDSERFANKGSPYLQRASALTTRQGNYSGTTLEGVPIRAKYQLVYEF